MANQMRAAMLAIASISAPAMASVKSDLLSAVSARSAAYQSQEQAQAAAYRNAVAALSSNPTKEQFVAVSEIAQSIGYATGRRIVSNDFGAFLRSGPNATKSDLWMQERVSQIQRAIADARAADATAKALPSNSADQILAKVEAMDKAQVQMGAVRGMVDEMQLVDANLRLYLNNRQASANRWRAIAAALGGASQNMAPPPLPPAPMQTDCQTFGNRTSCTTR